VVVEPWGTTTVVFAGGFGLLLLMQPDSMAAAKTQVARIFIFASTEGVTSQNSALIVVANAKARHGAKTHSGMSRSSFALSSRVLHSSHVLSA
jgi:hypothetical protein